MKKSKIFTAALMAIVLLSLCSPEHWPAYAAGDAAAGRAVEGRGVQSASTLYIPLAQRIYSATKGVVYGIVIDAGNGDPLPGATVCYGSNCATSNMDGAYELTGLPPGALALIVSASGYISVSEVVPVAAGQSIYRQFTLTEDLLELTDVFIRAVLNWSNEEYFSTPNPPYLWENDLDTHMWMQIEAQIWHVYSGDTGDCTTFPNLCMPVDMRLGSGPETTDISQLEPSATYYFGVHNVNYHWDPTNLPMLSELDVVVRLYDDDGLQRTFENPPSGSGDFWYLFQMDDLGFVTTANANCLMPYPGDSVPVCP